MDAPQSLSIGWEEEEEGERQEVVPQRWLEKPIHQPQPWIAVEAAVGLEVAEHRMQVLLGKLSQKSSGQDVVAAAGGLAEELQTALQTSLRSASVAVAGLEGVVRPLMISCEQAEGEEGVQVVVVQCHRYWMHPLCMGFQMEQKALRLISLEQGHLLLRGQVCRRRMFRN